MDAGRPQQPFPAATERWFRGFVALAATTAVLGLSAWMGYAWNNGYRDGATIEQPILFSHRHHAGDLGIDCRFCHSTVERSAAAGMPTTQTCLGCHRSLFRESPMLAPLWESVETNTPIRWKRVHDLKDVVYFNHAAHTNNGVSCVECHGEVAKMVTARQAEPLTMSWCLSCHRDPEPRLTAEGNVVTGTRPASRAGQSLPLEISSWESHYGIDSTRLTDCTTCHR